MSGMTTTRTSSVLARHSPWAISQETRPSLHRNASCDLYGRPLYLGRPILTVWSIYTGRDTSSRHDPSEAGDNLKIHRKREKRSTSGRSKKGGDLMLPSACVRGAISLFHYGAVFPQRDLPNTPSHAGEQGVGRPRSTSGE